MRYIAVALKIVIKIELGKRIAWAIVARRGSYESLYYLLNAGERKGKSVLNFFLGC